MTSSSSLRIWPLVALQTLLLFLGLLWLAADDVCIRRAEEIELKKAANCFEFWLNRYQGMLGALIAAGTAVWVVRPVFKQLREMTRQSAIGAANLSQANAIALEEERDAVNRVLTVGFRVGSSLGWPPKARVHAFPELGEALAELEALEPDVQRVRAAASRMSGPPTLKELRERYLHDYAVFKHQVRAQQMFVDIDRRSNGGVDPPPDYEAIDAVTAAYGSFGKRHNDLSKALHEAISAEWRLVGQLNHTAKGG